MQTSIAWGSNDSSLTGREVSVSCRKFSLRLILGRRSVSDYPTYRNLCIRQSAGRGTASRQPIAPDLLPRNLDQAKVNFSGYKTVRGEGV
jgi:hypothetical protein